MIIIKQGVDVRGLHILMWDMLYDIEPFFKEMNLDLWITSALEGDHSLKSRHYSGLAVDIRSRELRYPQDVYDRIKSVLHPAFDIVIEPTHFHLEYDPKTQDERIS